MTLDLPEFRGHSWPVRIVLVRTDQEWAALMAHVGAGEPRPSAHATTVWIERRTADDILAINISAEQIDARAYSERIGLYAHECVHVAQWCRRIIGGKLGSEVEAYLVQGLLLWIIGECEDWL